MFCRNLREIEGRRSRESVAARRRRNGSVLRNESPRGGGTSPQPMASARMAACVLTSCDRGRRQSVPRCIDGDAIAHPENLRQLRRDHQDRQPAPPGPASARESPPSSRRRRPASARRGSAPTAGRQPARQRDLLLIAARERADVGVDRRRLDAQVVDVAARGARSAARSIRPRRDTAARLARWRWPRPTSPARRRAAADPPARSRCPAAMASAATRSRTGAPPSRISPASAGRRPKRISASCVRPDPTRPARPRISPRRTVQRHVVHAGRAVRQRRAARARRRRARTSRLGKTADSSRPTISRIRSARGRPVARPWCRPSRRRAAP